ncbi:MAG: hypothetical protein ACE5HB_02485, partial [Terriglobia bacterium]
MDKEVFRLRRSRLWALVLGIAVVFSAAAIVRVGLADEEAAGFLTEAAPMVEPVAPGVSVKALMTVGDT